MKSAHGLDGAADWVLCPACLIPLYGRRFARDLGVCGECGRHTPITAEQRIAHHWTEVDGSFSARLGAQLDDLRTYYHRFNRSPGARNVWSPLSRLRLDLVVLGKPAANAVDDGWAFQPPRRNAWDQYPLLQTVGLFRRAPQALQASSEFHECRRLQLA